MQQIENSLNRIYKQIALENMPLDQIKPISRQFRDIGIYDLYFAIEYVNNLPYAPPSDKFNWRLVLIEKIGTCSTKHALLVELAREIGVSFALGSGIYKMSGINLPVVQSFLEEAGLSYIPESHNFIVFNKYYLDITFPHFAKVLRHDVIDDMHIIETAELVKIKTQTYQEYLKKWLLTNKPEMSIEQYDLLHTKIIKALGKSYI